MPNAAAAPVADPIDFEAETDEAIEFCDGDMRAALKATLIANAFLQSKLERITAMLSAGYGRGRDRKPAKRQPRITRIVVGEDEDDGAA